MRGFVSVIALTIFCLVSFAQGGTSTPKGFIDDYDAAIQISKKTGKPIYAVFSGSDWCYWCKGLKQGYLSKSEFIKKASKKFVLVFIDSPRDKTKLMEKARVRNPELKKQYQIRGFPTVLFITADGESTRVPRPGRDMTPREYVELLGNVVLRTTPADESSAVTKEPEHANVDESSNDKLVLSGNYVENATNVIKSPAYKTLEVRYRLRNQLKYSLL